MTQAKPAGLRERLAGRPRPSESVRLQVSDPAEAQAELDKALAEQRQVVIRSRSKGETAAKRRAQAKVDQARAEVDACYADVVLTALKPAEYEALIEAHPPTEEQRAKKEIWNVDTFRPDLLAACCPDMTAEQWAEFLAEDCSKGERDQLWLTALSVNERVRAPEPSLGKDSTSIINALLRSR